MLNVGSCRLQEFYRCFRGTSASKNMKKTGSTDLSVNSYRTRRSQIPDDRIFLMVVVHSKFDINRSVVWEPEKYRRKERRWRQAFSINKSLKSAFLSYSKQPSAFQRRLVIPT